MDFIKGNDFFIVRFGEIGTKSPRVRKRFISALERNISQLFLKKDLDCFIEKTMSRLYVYPEDMEKAKVILSSVFGIVSFSPGQIHDISAKESIIKISSGYAEKVMSNNVSFAVRTKRIGSHSYSSQEINIEAGSAIMDSDMFAGVRVDLTSPDITIHIEIRQNKTYIYHRVVEGLGGLPYGVSGSSVFALGNRDSIVGAYLMMKRGNRGRFIYTPDIYRESLEKEELMRILDRYLIKPKLDFLDDDDDDVCQDTRSTLEYLLERCGFTGSDALVVGFTMDEMPELIRSNSIPKARLPIFFPVLTFSKAEVNEKYLEISGM